MFIVCNQSWTVNEIFRLALALCMKGLKGTMTRGFRHFCKAESSNLFFDPLVGRMLKLFTPTLRRSMPIAIKTVA